MATKDMLAAGLNCVEYKNGARHTLESYAEMALRTASKRAYLQGEGEKRQEWGIHTVILNKRGNPCHLCLPWVGRVLVDDVWSGGTAEESKKMGYPLMSTATSAGLYHPNCRDSHTTYFEGISSPPSRKWTKKELEEIERMAKKDARKNHARRQAERFGRLAKFSLDAENRRKYKAREGEWEAERKRLNSAKNQVEESNNTGYNIARTESELQVVVQGIINYIKNYANNESKWSGKINVNNSLYLDGTIGQKEWNCDISLIDSADDGTAWHEVLHSCSVSYYDAMTYAAYQSIEEASVEFLTQQICKEKKITHIPAYGDYTAILQVLNDKFCFGTDLDFAKELFIIPLPERYQWLKEKVDKGLRELDASFEDYNDVMDFVSILEGGNNGTNR